MNVKASPIDRQVVKGEAIYSPRPLAAKATQSAEVLSGPALLDDVSLLSGAFAQLSAGSVNHKLLLPPELATPPVAEKTRGRLVLDEAASALAELSALYADHYIREEEIPALAMAGGRLEKILEMERAISMLPRPIQERLKAALFDPLRELVAAAKKHEGMVWGAVQERDGAAFKRALAAGGVDKYTPLSLETVTKRSELNGAHRYAIGDPIRVALPQGGAAFGFVTQKKEDGSLIAEWLDQRDQIHLVEMSPEKVAKENILKIGDSFQNWGHTYWVTGIDERQNIRLVDETGARYDAFEMMNRLVPLERMGDSPTLTSGLFAGNAASKTVFVNRARGGEVALHTHRGHGYKDHNEDAGATFVDSRGRIYSGVFDQAGGEGSDPNQLGAASREAGLAFFEQTREVARRGGSLEDGVQALLHAVQSAHQSVLGRGKREVSTFVGAMIEGRRAVVVNLGDSGAMLFDARGTFQTKTVDQGLGRMIFDGIGYPHKDGRAPQPDVYRWEAPQGGYLVLGSDGLFDSGLSEAQLGAVVARAGSAEAATKALRDLIVERMKSGEGKKDNLTISVVRVE